LISAFQAAGLKDISHHPGSVMYSNGTLIIYAVSHWLRCHCASHNCIYKSHACSDISKIIHSGSLSANFFKVILKIFFCKTPQFKNTEVEEYLALRSYNH
jgi:hypothetical protein